MINGAGRSGIDNTNPFDAIAVESLPDLPLVPRTGSYDTRIARTFLAALSTFSKALLQLQCDLLTEHSENTVLLQCSVSMNEHFEQHAPAELFDVQRTTFLKQEPIIE